MKNYLTKVAKLRKEMMADIERYLKETNKSVFVEKGRLSYVAFDERTNSGEEDELGVIPEIEIAVLTPNKNFGFIFVDAKGQEGTPGWLSTDELWAVCDYLLSAPKE